MNGTPKNVDKTNGRLIRSVHRGDLAGVERALADGADAKIVIGDFPLLWEASSWGMVDIAKALIRYGADVNLPLRSNGEPPLGAACANGDIAMVSLLLEADADAGAANFDGETPAHCAALGDSGDRLAVLAALASHGADLAAPRKDDLQTPLDFAREHSTPEVVEALLKHMNKPDWHQNETA